MTPGDSRGSALGLTLVRRDLSIVPEHAEQHFDAYSVADPPNLFTDSSYIWD